jgi:hypothetical protein
VIALLLLACAKEEAPAAACELDGADVLVVRVIRFAIADDAGVSLGFDLDRDTSDACDIEDYTSPTGTPGIDNAFSRLAPTLDATEAKVETIEGLIQAAVDSGELLIAIEVGGLDGDDDDCVATRVGQASGDVMLGTDGLLLDGQTFERDEAAPSSTLEPGVATAGAIEARGLSIDLPVQILNASLSLPLRDGALHLEPAVGDTRAGWLAGGVRADYLLEVSQTENVDPTVAELLGAVLQANADLDDEYGEACASVSITLEFEAVGAYFYE